MVVTSSLSLWPPSETRTQLLVSVDIGDGNPGPLMRVEDLVNLVFFPCGQLDRWRLKPYYLGDEGKGKGNKFSRMGRSEIREKDIRTRYRILKIRKKQAINFVTSVVRLVFIHVCEHCILTSEGSQNIMQALGVSRTL